MAERQRPPVAPPPLVPAQVVQLMRAVQFPEFNSAPAIGQPAGTPLGIRCDQFGLQYARTIPANNEWSLQGSQTGGGAVGSQQRNAEAGTRLVLDYIIIGLACAAAAQAAIELTINDTNSTQVGRAVLACPANDSRNFIATGMHAVIADNESVGSPIITTWTGALAAGVILTWTIGGYVI